MRRDFYILWVDDEFSKQNYSLIDMVNEVDTYISNLGFKAVIEKRNNFDDATIFLNSHPKIDMFICDYNIGEKKGIELFRDIRVKYKQDLILYSNIGKLEIKKEIIAYLEQPIAPEFFSRFTFASLNDYDGTIEVIEKIIQLNIMKWQEINGLRGMVLAEVSQIHHDLIDKIKQSELIRSTLDNIYNSNLTIEQKLKHGHIKKYLQGEELSEKIDFSIICNMLIPFNNVLFQQYKEIAEIRNSLAHVKEELDQNGYYLHSLKNPDFIIYEKDITDIRKKVLKFEDDFEAYLNTLSF